MLRWLWIVVLILVCHYPTAGQEIILSETGLHDISELLRTQVDEGEIPAIEVVVFGRSGVLFHETVGIRNDAENIPLEKGDLFNVASMAKPLTAVAVMILVEEGAISLDDPIAMRLPEATGLEVIRSFDPSDTTYVSSPPETTLRIRHLLNHTSGMAYPWWDERLRMIAEKNGDARTLHYEHWDVPLLHEPGEEWSYGVSARVLGELVEAVSGERLDRFLARRILEPLGMTSTFYEIPSDALHRRVTIHVREDDGALVERSLADHHDALIIGDAALLSTGTDYARFLRMLLNDGELDGMRILSEDVVETMIKNQIGDLVVRELFNEFPKGAEVDKFGFGFQVALSAPEFSWWRAEGSYSWAGSNNTFFWVDPLHGVGAVILMHYVPFFDTTAQAIYEELGRLIYQEMR